MHFLQGSKNAITKVIEGKPVGIGPCTPYFTGKNCEFYPALTILEYYRPSCNDKKGSFCSCMWFCWNKKDVFEALNRFLKEVEVKTILVFLTTGLYQQILGRNHFS